MESLKRILEYKDKVELASAKELGNLIFERMFSPKDLGINYRTIVHWEEKGILTSDEIKKEPNKWRNFSFNEVIWTDLVNEVRELGFSIPQVLQLKKNLFDPYQTEDFQRRFQLNKVEGMSKIESNLLKNNKEELQKVERFKTKPVNEIKFSKKVNPLAPLIVMFLIGREDTVFHIYADGSYDSYNPETELSLKSWDQSHISISLGSIMQKYILRDKNFTNDFSLFALTKDELTVLHYIRKGDLKSLTILFNDDSTIKLLEAKELKKVDVESRFLEHILKNGYQEIKFKTQGGKITTFESTTKHKLKS